MHSLVVVTVVAWEWFSLVLNLVTNVTLFRTIANRVFTCSGVMSHDPVMTPAPAVRQTQETVCRTEVDMKILWLSFF